VYVFFLQYECEGEPSGGMLSPTPSHSWIVDASPLFERSPLFWRDISYPILKQQLISTKWERDRLINAAEDITTFQDLWWR